MYIHSNLKHLRKLRGYSADTVSNVIGIPRSTLSAWENGASQPNCSMLLKLGDYYRLSLDLLLGKDLVTMPNSTIAIMQAGY
jgi:transcriptional regulator with XRE-family HTH domain